MENLEFYVPYVLGLMGLIFVVFSYCVYNITIINRNHEELKRDLKARLFFLTIGGGQIDLISVVNALVVYSKLRIEQTGGVKIVKE